VHALIADQPQDLPTPSFVCSATAPKPSGLPPTAAGWSQRYDYRQVCAALEPIYDRARSPRDPPSGCA
jgi:hypothetical protein